MMTYKLSTGNNETQAMTWDANLNTFYAATNCNYVSPSGYCYPEDYRRLKLVGENSNQDNEHGVISVQEAIRDTGHQTRTTVKLLW
jgi:hypothetical protein